MKNALIVGYGKSGEGSAKLLEKQGYKVSVYDDNKNIYCESRCNVSFCDDWTAVADKDLVVISPSIDQKHHIVEYAKKCNIEVIGEIELGYRACVSEIIAITGTNGKTTTTLFMRDILRNAGLSVCAVGNIGYSFCGELADNDMSEDDIVVLEVSSFQLESIDKFRSKYAVCLNVSPDHLERHGTMEKYAMTKAKIFCNQLPQDYAILNYDDETVRNFSDGLKSNVYYFSVNQRVKGVYVSGDNIVFDNGEKKIVCDKAVASKLGEHNLDNFLACILIAKLIGVDNEIIVKTLKEFKPPRYRNQFLGTYEGKKIFNDSKGTNIDSTIKACNMLTGNTAIIVGGYNKGISYSGFFATLPTHVKHIIACGDNVYEMMQFLPDYYEFTYEITSTLERAVELSLSKEVDNILFSPTTSSFDRYSGYIERGEHFDRVIKEMTNGQI